jgi:hypothetical protein
LDSGNAECCGEVEASAEVDHGTDDRGSRILDPFRFMASLAYSRPLRGFASQK